MNRTYIFKVVLITINAVCIVMSIQFVYQIMKIQEETITMMKKDFEKMDDKFEILNTDLKELLQDYQKMQESYHRNRNEYSQLQSRYKIKQYINAMVCELDQETLENTNVSRYFKVEKEELTQIISNVDILKEIDIQEIIDQREKDVIPIGEGIWLQYKKGEELPESLIVQNPEINIGYEKARAGMQLDYIMNFFSDSKDGIVISPWETHSFLQLEDAEFRYYYIAFDGRENPTVLCIVKKGN